MKMKVAKWLVAAGCALLTACAVITVNVYFPEKAAKEAYKSLDEMLLKTNGEKTPGEAQPPAAAPGEAPQPAPAPAEPEVKPQSSLGRGLSGFSLVGTAYAADSEADTLAVELSSMPEVLKAYDEMNKRLPRLTALFDSGVVGLNKQGLVTVKEKGKATPQDDALVKGENENRKTVVMAMAKAIVKLNKQPVTKEAVNQVLGKAATTFAETKREAAKPGWWTELENGRWVQK